jgi:epoxyqueuosine reductase QueG
MATEISSVTVKEYGLSAGASIVGIAASKDFNLAPDGNKPSDCLQSCLSVIVLGAPFPQEALLKSTAEYTEIRNEMVKKMDAIAKKVTKQIAANGYKAKAIGSVNSKGYYGPISLKHAAELAGLGIIGRNYLLTNPEYGNLLFFSAVLTDANLISDKKAQYTICNNCNKCVEMCPAKALDNPNLFGKQECAKICIKVSDKLEFKCFLCRKVCPNRFGNKSK